MARTAPPLKPDEITAGRSRPGGTSARGASGPGSQGTNSVRGTWLSEGEAGCHLRTTAEAAGTPSPAPPPHLWDASHRSRAALTADGDVWRGLRGVACNLIVWKRAIPKNRMRESFTSGSVGRLGAQAPGFTRTPERRIGAESEWKATWPPPGDASRYGLEERHGC
jgi:hypothetical protein